FDDLSVDGPSDLRWSALYVKARAEKAVARKLRGHGLSFFLPQYRQEWRSQGRLRSSYLPLFPGYVFLFAVYASRIPVLETNLVLRFLHVEDQEQLRADLSRVHRLIEAGLPLTPVERLKPGTLVEVTSGVLEGTRGKIVRQGRQLQFIVEVQFLQRGVALEIGGRFIRPVSEALAVAN